LNPLHFLGDHVAAKNNVVLSYCNVEADSSEFMNRFIAEAKRSAAEYHHCPAALESEPKQINKKIANLVATAEKGTSSPTLATANTEFKRWWFDPATR
jgi:hypothetical protein